MPSTYPQAGVLAVLAVRALQPEERALVPVLALFLVDEVQLADVEGVEPLVPADVAQGVGVAAEVESQHAQVVAVLGALDGRRYAAALLGPLPDHLVAGGDQAAAGALRVLVGRGHVLRVLDRLRRLGAGAHPAAVGTAVAGLTRPAPAAAGGAAARGALAGRRRQRADELLLLHRRRALDALVLRPFPQLVDLHVPQLGLAQTRGVRCLVGHGGLLPGSEEPLPSASWPAGNSSSWGRRARRPPGSATTTATCCAGTPRASSSTRARARSGRWCTPASPPRPSPGCACRISTATTSSACPVWSSGCRWTRSRTRSSPTTRRPDRCSSTGCGTPRPSTRSPSCGRSRCAPTGPSPPAGGGPSRPVGWSTPSSRSAIGWSSPTAGGCCPSTWPGTACRPARTSAGCSARAHSTSAAAPCGWRT